ncbi:MAG: non-lysosomal glucosylceramidase [Anaerolineae bacterium]|nr:non-lysosomal glucosylceramidase [Anaerolineae bacterium]
MTNAGLPRMAGTTFYGEYPFATIEFDSADLPVQVQLEAYTPLIPLNPEDSGIPCAILTYTVANTAAQPVTLTLVGSLTNPVSNVQFDAYSNVLPGATGRTVNTFRDEGALRGLYMFSDQTDPGALNFGNMSLVTDHPSVTVKPAWYRGGWWDFLQEFWDDLAADGLLDDLGYDEPGDRPDTGSLGVTDTLNPGERKAYRFILTWFFPNRLNTWDRSLLKPLGIDEKEVGVARNHYATRFGDAWEVARYVHDEMPRLEADTRKFHAALFGSTLPPAVLDAVSANIVPMRSNTCFWLEDGRFYGWEGCFDDAGCCPGSCTHVWSYAQTIAFLFPSLEREMRRIEFGVETEADGFMHFRSYKTFHGELAWGVRESEAAIDGQMGSILRAYREWQLSGDRAYLAEVWPGIKRGIAFAAAHWDADGDGVLDGKQHNTYDIQFYGPNPLSSVHYLAALRAVEEMARVMGEPELAQRSRALFESGRTRLDELTWNGKYFIQRIDDVDAYKYQHGVGCLSDQLLGQLHAHVLGLGDLLPADHVRAAVKSIFDHNFMESFRNHVNCQRTYALNDEAGLVLCTWPDGGRPRFPFVYSDEVWTGVEYQVAAHLIYEGWLDEGVTLVQAVRDRHDGVRRNPWDEVECGHHYARSMSSWAVLLALSGAQGDLGRGVLNFAPVAEASPDPEPVQRVLVQRARVGRLHAGARP